MNTNDNNRNGSGGLNTQVSDSSEPTPAQAPIPAPELVDGAEKAEPVTRFATRTAAKGAAHHALGQHRHEGEAEGA